MPSACPRCKDHTQVVHWPEFYKSLPRESELRSQAPQPAEYKAQLLLPAGACAVGAVALVSGAVAAGLLLVAGGIGVGVWLWRKSSAADDARARWARTLYCRRCPVRFLPEEAVAV
ncbi:hypothetical protein [Streptomyces sp. N2A]|uniref:hypothetical protein n=1 Tax=Streptomyces sp. N2A TaxID=3073936 RepID=UPI00286FF61C|nr:hypothetical protein [Streptomyces sp. N2A]